MKAELLGSGSPPLDPKKRKWMVIVRESWKSGSTAFDFCSLEDPDGNIIQLTSPLSETETTPRE